MTLQFFPFTVSQFNKFLVLFFFSVTSVVSYPVFLPIRPFERCDECEPRDVGHDIGIDAVDGITRLMVIQMRSVGGEGGACDSFVVEGRIIGAAAGPPERSGSPERVHVFIGFFEYFLKLGRMRRVAAVRAVSLSDHVEVEHGIDRVERGGDVIDKVFRSFQSCFFSAEEGKDD